MNCRFSKLCAKQSFCTFLWDVLAYLEENLQGVDSKTNEYWSQLAGQYLHRGQLVKPGAKVDVINFVVEYRVEIRDFIRFKNLDSVFEQLKDSFLSVLWLVIFTGEIDDFLPAFFGTSTPSCFWLTRIDAASLSHGS